MNGNKQKWIVVDQWYGSFFFWKEINELIIKKARKEISNLKKKEVTMQLWDNILLITTIIV